LHKEKRNKRQKERKEERKLNEDLPRPSIQMGEEG
jgi:hypothetical protein